MAVGLSTAAASDVLDLLTDATEGYRWVQLHTADPGAAGTAAVATEADRIQITSFTGSGATRSNGNALQWTSVAGAETYSHFTVWTAATAGTFGFSGTVSANAVTAGDTFTIPLGDLDLSIPTAS